METELVRKPQNWHKLHPRILIGRVICHEEVFRDQLRRDFRHEHGQKFRDEHEN